MMLNAIKQMYANFRHYCFLRCNGGVDPRETLRAKLAESEQRVKALEEALQKARDVSSAALARVDKLRAENKALEAACQK